MDRFALYRSSAMTASPVPGQRSARALPAAALRTPAGGAAAGEAEAAGRRAEDRGRVVRQVADVVVQRLFAAGLDLQAALALTGDHPAAGKIGHAIGELDLAIADLRDAGFGAALPAAPGAENTRR
jgi:hypothetical protein